MKKAPDDVGIPGKRRPASEEIHEPGGGESRPVYMGGEVNHGKDFFKNVLNSLPYPQYLINANSLAVIWKMHKSQYSDGTWEGTCAEKDHGLLGRKAGEQMEAIE